MCLTIKQGHILGNQAGTIPHGHREFICWRVNHEKKKRSTHRVVQRLADWHCTTHQIGPPRWHHILPLPRYKGATEMRSNAIQHPSFKSTESNLSSRHAGNKTSPRGLPIIRPAHREALPQAHQMPPRRPRTRGTTRCRRAPQPDRSRPSSRAPWGGRGERKP